MPRLLEPAQFIELKASGNLPSPKGSALKVMEICQRDNVTLPEIIQAVRVDPAMVGRLLKMANSAAFGRPRPAVALTSDVLMSVGIQSVRQMVLAFSLVSGNRQGQCRGFDYEKFWSRSTATGVAMQLIGAATRAAPPAELFTVGLLAHIGRLALAALHPKRYDDMLPAAGGQFAFELTALEKESFGYSHLEVAATMMQDWGLPKLFCDTVLFHETPALAGFMAGSRSAGLVACLHLAVQMAELCFVAQSERKAEFVKLHSLALELGIADESLLTLSNQMLCEWKEWGALLDISVPELASFSPLDVADEGAAEVTEDLHEGITILVVDDDPTVCLLLKKLLAADGHSVHLARHGDEALAQALHHQPQLVITDLLMPQMDGLQLIKGLRQTELGRSIYIIVLSIVDDEDTLAEALALGADEVIIKPVEGRLLQARLKAAMRIIRELQKQRQEQNELRRRLLELSIVNQRAQNSALIDVLTGLYNRRHAMARLAQEMADAERSHRSLSLLMLDIDHFKAINDNHGHDAGDAVLRQFAEVLRGYSRTPDVACRIGGEEFLIILPDTELQGAQHLAERIRSAIQNQTMVAAEISLKLTASIGVAEKRATVHDPDQFIKLADEALYAAKQGGRNRVAPAHRSP